jgi:membrane-associated phospholipid phosphatase
MPSNPTFARARASVPNPVPTPVRVAFLIATSTIFVVAYALANLWTAQRTDIGQGVFDFERAIPFVPWTIVPYLSVTVFYAASFFVGDRAALDRHARCVLVNLALSLVCYALVPLRFQFERPIPAGICGALFELLGACDLPYNRAPSLHISVLLILWRRLLPFVPARWQALLHAWFALIGVSVLTTYQHHLIDIPAGLAVGALSVLLTSPAATGRLSTRRAQCRASARA